MISNTASNAFRLASRRVAFPQQGSANAQRAVRFSSNVLKTTAVETNNNNKSKVLLATSVGLVAAVAALQQQTNKTQNLSTNKTDNLFGKSAATAVKETEDKFCTYWPRNIMILL
ncbi:MAG: hypothetical protein ACI90V_013504 [Bacillariaceae sp.]|jgi:hypothetical protein